VHGAWRGRPGRTRDHPTSGGTAASPNGVAFRGTLTAKGESGTIDATLPSGTKIASLRPRAGQHGRLREVNDG
jgi:hypothetical protein